MSEKFSDLDLRELPDEKWRLLADLSYELRWDFWKKTKVIITVPKGFVTDLASIPKPLHGIISPLGDNKRAAVVHDWLYFRGITTRKIADGIFVEALKDLGVPYWKRKAMYWGVRIGGWVAYAKHRKNKRRSNEDNR